MKIFTSYRRDDESMAVGRIVNDLRVSLGSSGVTVFQDIDIPAGENWKSRLQKELCVCSVLLACIGKGWHRSWHDDVGPRLWHEDDYVRMEVSEGLKSKEITTVPVLIGDASMPKNTALPFVLRELPNQQTHKIRSDEYRFDFERLVNRLRQILDDQRPATDLSIERSELELTGSERVFTSFVKL